MLLLTCPWCFVAKHICLIVSQKSPEVKSWLLICLYMGWSEISSIYSFSCFLLVCITWSSMRFRQVPPILVDIFFLNVCFFRSLYLRHMCFSMAHPSHFWHPGSGVVCTFKDKTYSPGDSWHPYLEPFGFMFCMRCVCTEVHLEQTGSCILKEHSTKIAPVSFSALELLALWVGI